MRAGEYSPVVSVSRITRSLVTQVLAVSMAAWRTLAWFPVYMVLDLTTCEPPNSPMPAICRNSYASLDPALYAGQVSHTLKRGVGKGSINIYHFIFKL